MKPTTRDHPLVNDYLHRLRDECRRLPHAQGDELYADIRAHLRDALGGAYGEMPSEVEVRAQLDRTGDPAELVTDAGGTEARPARGDTESTAVGFFVLAELTSFLFPLALVCWIVGGVQTIRSRAWTGGQKLACILVLGSGILVVFVGGLGLAGGSVTTCFSSTVTPLTGPHAGHSRTTSANCPSPGMPWGVYVAMGVAVVYLVAQVWTAWRLLRRRR